MYLLRLTIILILTAGLTGLHAQELNASEFTALKQYRMERIDSLMTAKGFKKETREEKDFTIIIYTYQQVRQSSFVMRSLHLGWQPALKSLDIQYGVWQQDEAANFMHQLEQVGYKKTTSSVPNLDGTTSKDIAFKKGAAQIAYQIQRQTKTTLHLFSTTSENYTP